MQNFFLRIPVVLRYGVFLSAGIVLLKTLEYQLFSFRFSFELYAGLLALFFLLLGLITGYAWISMRRTRSAVSLGLSAPLTATEQRLLLGLVEGCSNQQLADQHHVSINTIKTHLKNLYRKLRVRNRAEAAAVARELSLI